MTTDTPDTTRLSEDDLNALVERTGRCYYTDEAEVKPKDWDALIASHRTLTAQLSDRDAEIVRLTEALESVIAETGAIWDDDNPVHPAHGSRLDMMLFAAKTAIAAPSAADRDHAGESGEVG